MPRVANGLGIIHPLDPKGVMADHEAREQNVGGEVLCRSSDPEANHGSRQCLASARSPSRCRPA
jgi:hypothetical protein